MGFAEELAQSRQGISTPKTETTTVAEAAPPAAEAGPAMPEHGSPFPESPTVSAAAPIDPEPKLAPQPKTGKIRIGSEVFESTEEALAFAQEAIRDQENKTAFEAGKLAAAPKPAEAPAKDMFDDLESEIFEKPKEAAKKIYQSAKDDAKAEIRAEMAREEQTRKVWEGFYSENQDLVSNKDLVGYVMEKNWKDVANLPLEKSLKILADKTRAMMGSRKETTLPTKELSSTKVASTSASGVATATIQEKKQSASTFIEEMIQMRKGKK